MKEILKIYGPYISKKDNRKRVIIRYTDKTMSVHSYARFLYMQKHGEIDPNLTVDHIDEDCSNDIIDNLQLLTRKENAEKAALNGKNGIKEWYKGICPNCNVEFIKPACYVKHNRKMGKAGPFCSRKCAGVYGKNIQIARIAQLAGGN